MVYKIFVLDSNLRSGLNDPYLQILVGNVKDESLYSEFQSIDEESGKVTYDTHELTVNVNDMIKMRDYLTKLINKCSQGKVHGDDYDYYGNIVSISNDLVEGE